VLKKWSLACHFVDIRADQMLFFALQHPLCYVELLTYRDPTSEKCRCTAAATAGMFARFIIAKASSFEMLARNLAGEYLRPPIEIGL
jgi:hypothetical protein